MSNLHTKIKFSIPQINLSLIIIIVLVVVWLSNGIFIVEPQEQAVIKRFGEVYDVVGPGPHYHLPAPIETVQIESVTAVRRIEIGFRTIDPGPPAKFRQVTKESLMLTGDENIVDMQFVVQYKISNIEDYLYNLTNPEVTVKSAAESAMREVVGNTTVTQALTVGKAQIENITAKRLQETLDNYKSGILISNVKMQDVHPPSQVKEAFKDVVSAKEDREKLINEAEGYNNNLIPKARGEAKQIINSARAYVEKTTLIAKGKANRFNSIYKEYRKAKEITRERIMLETMETVLPKVNKVISDSEVSRNFLPFLNITELKKSVKKP